MNKEIKFRLQSTVLSLALLLIHTGGLYAQDTMGSYAAAYHARADSVIDFYATRIPADDVSRGGYYEIAARLMQEKDQDWVYARLDSILSKPPVGDMFWMFPFVTAWFAGLNELEGDYPERLRDLWRTYMPYRGDTENHWALYYATLYLMAEQFPEDGPETWFTGKSARENREEAKEYLIEWMRITTTIGQGEYDSPHYLKVFVAPMALLYGYVQDPELRQRAEMMLDYFIADFAVEHLEGNYGGAHSRLYEYEILDEGRTSSARFAWLLWGAMDFMPLGELYILSQSGYQPPYLLYQIATDRTEPYIHKEKKRTRHRIRNSEIKNAPVYKYTAMRPGYVLGSSQGGLLQPIQQQTWGLTWVSENTLEKHNQLFTLHPYYDANEGTMYFAEHEDMVTELIARSKKEYNTPNKWTGGSPYEQVFQHEDALVALYKIPGEDNSPHINGYFSRDLKNLEEDPSGWIFAKGGEAMIAYYPLADYSWEVLPEGDRRLYSEKLENGALIQVAGQNSFASFQAFKEAVLSGQVEVEEGPGVSFTTLAGDLLQIRYGEPPVVNGTPVEYAGWPLFEGPYLNAEPQSGRLEICYQTSCRLLDFNTLSSRDFIRQ